MIVLLLFFCLISFCHAAESRVIDGKVFFAYGEINGSICWTESEFDEATTNLIPFVATSPVIISIIYTPIKWEISLSTNTDFTSYSDWKISKTKAGLRQKLIKAKQEFDVIGDQNSRQKYEWLKSYRDSLP